MGGPSGGPPPPGRRELQPKRAYDDRHEKNHGPRACGDRRPQHPEPRGDAVPHDCPIVDHSLSLGPRLCRVIGKPRGLSYADLFDDDLAVVAERMNKADLNADVGRLAELTTFVSIRPSTTRETESGS